MYRRQRQDVWLFDLDDTLHHAGAWLFPQMNAAITRYIQQVLQLPYEQADALRVNYWRRYGSTVIGLMRHHQIAPAHFLHQTHQFPDLEDHVHGHRHDLVALQKLPGRRVLLTNAPKTYVRRVLSVLGLAGFFSGIYALEDMKMFGHWRPKPDARMLRCLAVRLGVAPQQCILVEDTLSHQKAARRVGMTTVWMQRWQAKEEARRHRKPSYVDIRIRRLRELL